MNRTILTVCAVIFVAGSALAEEFELTVNVVGNGIADPNSGTYETGAVVTIETWPEAGYWVKAWTGADNDSSTELTNTVTMVSDKIVIVEFGPAIIVNKPFGGDIWTSGSIHTIKWSSYGAGTVDILFSKNDGSNWQTIESSLADTGGYTWYLPDIVDSNKCLISIVPSVPNTNVVCIESGLFTIGPDSPDPVVPSKWKSLGGGFRRSGLSENYGPEVGCVKWRFDTNLPVFAGVTIGVDGRVVITCEDGSIYTLDEEGSLLWSYVIRPPVITTKIIGPHDFLYIYEPNLPPLSSPTIGQDGTVYVGSTDGKLYAIDINGNLRWTHTTDGFIYSSPAVSEDGKVYVCSQDGVLYALGQDGSELWSFETDGFGVIGGSIFGSPAIGTDGTVYIAGLYDPNLYALDPNDGNLKWACNLTDPCDPDSRIGWPFASPVVATDGTIYQTLLYDANLYAIEPNDGNIIWSLDLADPCSGWFDSGYANRYGCAGGWSEPALGPDGTIYVSYDDPYLRAVDPNGTIKWVTQLGMMGGFTLAVGSDGLIYAASDDGYLCVVNPHGEEVARFEGYGWLSFPVIAGDNTIIVSDANNTVWAIGADNCEEQIPALHRPQDLNTDWAVNFLDFALLAADWLDCTDTEMYPQETEPPCDYSGDEIYLIGDIDRSLYVDLDDIAALANRWLNGE